MIKTTKNPPAAIPIIAARERSPLFYGGEGGLGGARFRSSTFTFYE